MIERSISCRFYGESFTSSSIKVKLVIVCSRAGFRNNISILVHIFYTTQRPPSIAGAEAFLFPLDFTGGDSHAAGVSNMPELLAPEQRTQPQYQGELGDNVVTVATLLEGNGYHTYMAGKWHLGSSPEKRPSRRGFERTLALMDSGADNWEQRPYMPLYDRANWFADGERFTLPDDFYSSRFLVDKTIEFIESNREDGKPFFAYLPFQAVHMPVQAPQAYIDKYQGVYDAGWDALRHQRRLAAVQLGIVPPDTAMVDMSTTDDWNALDEQRQRYESKRMAVYAGMIEAMDFHIGRLVTYLKSQGQYGNTIFIFTSDNGSEASGAADQMAFAQSIGPRQLGYHSDYDRLGLKGSFNTIGPSFASASARPLSHYKFYAGEGGLRVPMIWSWPGHIAAGQTYQRPVISLDILPTVLAAAGGSIEAESIGTARRPRRRIYDGVNLLPFLGEDGRQGAPHDHLCWRMMMRGAAVRKGQWKLVRTPFAPPQLYDLQADIAQELIRAGVSVMVFNQRSVSGILDMMKTLGAMVGASESAQVLIDECRVNLEHARARARTPYPRVYFEEWDTPQISAIRWVSELIEAAGGEDLFPELAQCPDGKSRIIADPEEVVRRRPDIIIGSWCGKKFRPEKVAARPGWSAIPAVRNNALYEIKSAEILQPGPAALSDGLSRLRTILDAWHAAHDRPVHQFGQDITD